jgi:hypothetical protein
MKAFIGPLLFVLLGLAVSLIVTGCQSTESANVSSRPWNAPTTWQNGLPSNLNEGR